MWNGQGLPSVRTLSWHLVLNKAVVLFLEFHQNQPNSRVACMFSPLYVATPWTYRHPLSCGGNEWFDVFMNILCSSHWNQAEHPCLHKYKKMISKANCIMNLQFKQAPTWSMQRTHLKKWNSPEGIVKQHCTGHHNNKDGDLWVLLSWS